MRCKTQPLPDTERVKISIGPVWRLARRKIGGSKMEQEGWFGAAKNSSREKEGVDGKKRVGDGVLWSPRVRARGRAAASGCVRVDVGGGVGRRVILPVQDVRPCVCCFRKIMERKKDLGKA